MFKILLKKYLFFDKADNVLFFLSQNADITWNDLYIEKEIPNKNTWSFPIEKSTTERA